MHNRSQTTNGDFLASSRIERNTVEYGSYGGEIGETSRRQFEYCDVVSMLGRGACKSCGIVVNDVIFRLWLSMGVLVTGLLVHGLMSWMPVISSRLQPVMVWEWALRYSWQCSSTGEFYG